MLGRDVARAIRGARRRPLVSDDVLGIARSADLCIVNLECCLSNRGERWAAPGKPFFFRGPPQAIDLLVDLGVDCVTLANNHALDYGYTALADTISLLNEAGIVCVGAGRDVDEARTVRFLRHGASRVGVLGLTDHPLDYAASKDRAGVAFADLGRGVPPWVSERINSSKADVIVVTPHWGPNMRSDPEPYVRFAARELVEAGADLIAGHSAHVFQGVSSRILFDLGDFIDDYATDPSLRNDLGILWLVTLRGRQLEQIEAFPLKIDYCHTRLAVGEDLRWIRARLVSACASMGSSVEALSDRLRIVQ